MLNLRIKLGRETFGVSIILIGLLVPEITGIADKAAYFIQNAQDGLCITAGPIIDKDSVSLFESGIPISANCTYGRGQQWVTSMKGIQNHIPIYKMMAFNSRNFNKMLNAKVYGEFISYFANFLELKPITISGNTYYLLHDTVTKKCFESMGENHVLHKAECQLGSSQQKSQHWTFQIVNQSPVPGSCTDFWSCNH